MTEQEAIVIALTRLHAIGTQIGTRPPIARRFDKNAPFWKDKDGWIVFVPIKVPIGIEPDELHVEVYEPNGEVYIHRMI